MSKRSIDSNESESLPSLPIENDDGYEGYEELVKENPLFELYYNTIIPKEEFQTFMDALHRPLPTSFRFANNATNFSSPLLKYMLDTFSPLPLVTPISIPWYPSAYVLPSTRKSIRTDPSLKSFHKWLCDATENGDICRQEVVSMIPPLFLNVHSGHLVLDMCAAPGSKTSQLLEMLNIENINAFPSSSDITINNEMKKDVNVNRNGKSLLIANDVNQQRAFMLYHQVRRVTSPALIITNNDACQFPKLLDNNGNQILFDRILCDVPCSGDGTMRKNVKLWRDWNVNHALGLHQIQLRILKRAIQLLKPGGLLVYSTCSLNPVENEAVIQAILKREIKNDSINSINEMELLDSSEMLPLLLKRPGLTDWRLMTKNGVFIDSLDQIADEDKKRFPETVFPCKMEILKRCIRIIPHDQDTSGFFIAVLKRKEMNESLVPVSNPLASFPSPSSSLPSYQIFKYKQCRDVVVLLRPHHPVIQNIFEYFKLNSKLHDEYGFITRSLPSNTNTNNTSSSSNSDFPIKSITIISKKVQNLLEGNNYGLKIINGGVKAFEIYDINTNNSYKCPYRISHEALDILYSHIDPSLVHSTTNSSMAKNLLSCDDSIMMEELSNLYNDGSLIIQYKNVLIPVWKRGTKIKAFVPKPNRPSLLLQVEYENN